MAQVGLTKAAELTGKAASTITRRAKHKDTNKRLSFTISNGGEKLYDVAELERVFGKLNSPIEPENSNDNATVQKTKNAIARNNLQQQLKQANEEAIALLQTQLEDTRKDRDEWREQAKKNTVLLEDYSKKQNQGMHKSDVLPEKTEEKRKGFFAKLFN